MKTTITAILICGALATARSAAADAPSIETMDRKPSKITVGLDAGGSHFGTAHQTLYQLTATPFARVLLGHGVEIFGALPLSGGFALDSACCRYGIGNATAGVGYHRLLAQRLSLTVRGSASLPTASADGAGQRNGLYAASTELTRDAGLFLPGTTTVRLGATAQYAGPTLFAAVQLAGHAWRHRGDEQSDTVFVVPIAAHLGWQATPALRPMAGLRALALLQSDASPAAAAEAGLEYRRPGSTYHAFLAVPFDDASREMRIVSLYGGVSWNL